MYSKNLETVTFVAIGILSNIPSLGNADSGL